MPIAVLSPLLINQIAAGEVIERPASVVKELVENSLDAHATRVDIVIEEGGRQLIRVSDNGVGIAPQELLLAVTAHATSKLREPEELATIGTLGFRGEAMASIASISRLRITSRQTVDGKPAEAAATLSAEGDVIGPVQPASGSPGTVVEVRELFFNTPARRKFLRGAPVEFGHISDTIERLAMVWPGVGFSLSHNGRKVIDVPADQTRRQRCVHLMGKELDEALLEFEARVPQEQPAQPTRIWGLAGKPTIARATAKFQFVCLNGRPIKDRGLAHAVREAYRGLIPPDQQPVAAVFIDIDPTLVDVNVHPAKSEVRFRDPSAMHGLVLSSLRQRLLGADLTPSATLAGNGNRGGAWPGSSGSRWGAPASATGFAPGTSNDTSSLSPASNGDFSVNAFVDYFKRMAPQQKGFVFDEVRKVIADENPNALIESPADTAGQASEAASASGVSLSPQRRPTTILQVHDSYVVTQDEQGLVIVDQHALHERVMFEQLRLKVSQKDLESQRLLMPVTLPASPKRIALLDALAPLLQRIGIEADAIGPQAIAVRAFPSMLFDRNVDPGEFMQELLDQAEDGKLDASAEGPRSGAGSSGAGSSAGNGAGNGAVEAALHEVLDMMACKAAVKAGQSMSHAELQALLDQREQIERASNCPHGRPTTIRLTLKDLEKQFKRT
jgi:DNA mismatch repair protein MutL